MMSVITRHTVANVTKIHAYNITKMRFGKRFENNLV